MTQKPSQLDALWRQALRVYGADIPDAMPEYRFHPVRRWRFDYAWPDVRVALELDGGQWAARGGRHNTDGDREKLNTAAACGWRVVRLSRSMLNDPAACVAVVRAAVEYVVLRQSCNASILDVPVWSTGRQVLSEEQ